MQFMNVESLNESRLKGTLTLTYTLKVNEIRKSAHVKGAAVARIISLTASAR